MDEDAKKIAEHPEMGKCFNCGGPMNKYAAKNAANNTTSSIATHILAAVELIIRARKEYKIESENYTYPILSFGYPNDPYYAEIWSDGMDWQNNYWLLETTGYNDPKAYPLIVFGHYDEEERIPQHDLNELLKAVMWRRRDMFWIKQNDDGVYGDTVWWCLGRVNRKDIPKNAKDDWEDVFEGGRTGMPLYKFGHASCPDTVFMFNESLILRPETEEPAPEKRKLLQEKSNEVPKTDRS